MPEYAHALYDFIPMLEDELPFAAGERIEVLEKDGPYNDGWWQGRNIRGRIGLFPRVYTSPYESSSSPRSTYGSFPSVSPASPSSSAESYSSMKSPSGFRDERHPVSLHPGSPLYRHPSPQPPTEKERALQAQVDALQLRVADLEAQLRALTGYQRQYVSTPLPLTPTSPPAAYPPSPNYTRSIPMERDCLFQSQIDELRAAVDRYSPNRMDAPPPRYE